MSLLKRIGRAIGGVAKTIAAPIVRSLPVVGPIAGAVLDATIKTVPRTPPIVPMASSAPVALPGGAAVAPGGAGMSVLSAVPRLAPLAPTVGRAAGVAVGATVAGARAIYNSAAAYCRRHPQWCASVGGIAAVSGMIQSGQLPAIKRKRRRGISATDLSKFRRVASFLYRWGPMCAGGARRPRRARTCR